MGTKFSDGTSSGINVADYGVWGDTSKGYGAVGTSATGIGVYGESTYATGVYGRSDAPGTVATLGTPVANGVFGENNQVLGVGVRAKASGQGGIGVVGTGGGTGVYGRSDLAGRATPDPSLLQGGIGVHGQNNLLFGIGVRGEANDGFLAMGVQGLSDGGTGVQGSSASGIGVHGENANASRIGNAPGVRGDGDAEDGVWAISKNANGIYAQGGNFAAYLRGKVFIAGPLIKPGGSFQIDHPLDPANKYLHHSFVESPDMKNIYDGIIVLDAKGQAEVKLPAWFHALNSEFRYQLTPIGASGPSLHIAQEIANNRFRIAGGAPRMKVSWQVTGVRVDAWAKAHRIQVEEDKPAEERGRYLHPELYNQPEEKAVDWALRSAGRARLSTEKPQANGPKH